MAHPNPEHIPNTHASPLQKYRQQQATTGNKKIMDENVTLNEHHKQEHEPAHTAEHLLNQTMARMFGCERSKNAHIERKKSKINFTLSVCPTQEQVDEIERRMNELIQEDLPVTYEYVTRDEIPQGVKLDKLPEDASETLRLVRIGHYDVCPCIGRHVKSTREIGDGNAQVGPTRAVGAGVSGVPCNRIRSTSSDAEPLVKVSQEVFRKILHSEVASAPNDGLQLVLHPQGCNCLPL